jgi:retinol dehydrogenase-13
MWLTIFLTLLITAVCLAITRQLAVKYYHKLNAHTSDIKGKLVVVTGATSGVGVETVAECFMRGATVVFNGRRAHLVKQNVIPYLLRRLELATPNEVLSQDEISQDIEDLKKGIYDKDGNFTSKRIIYRKCDLADLDQVKLFADHIISLNRPVQILFNNAGAVFGSYKSTTQNFESTTGVNILSHFYLAELLMENLANEARIICVSSIMSLFVANKIAKLDLDKVLNPSKEGYFNWAQYSYSKLGVVLLAAGIQKQLDKKKISAKAVSLHPGAIMSGFMSTMHPFIYYSYLAFKPIPWSFMKNCIEGAQTSLYCAFMPYKELEGGAYYSDCAKANRNKAVTEENTNEFMRRAGEQIAKATKRPLKNLSW